jgi:methionyl-tRNA formyltransferase
LPPARLHSQDHRLYAGCGDKAIELLEVQLEGKKKMEAGAFLNGFPLESEEVLA